ncbi:hypothetical protein P0F65_07190 [Sphingomonas sp. I4]
MTYRHALIVALLAGAAPVGVAAQQGAPAPAGSDESVWRNKGRLRSIGRGRWSRR